MWQYVILYKSFLEVLNSMFNEERTTGIIRQGDQKVSAPDDRSTSSGEQRLFDHSVYNNHFAAFI
jgi:elongation factor P hydroxylase